MLDRVWHSLPRVCRVTSLSRSPQIDMVFEGEIEVSPAGVSAMQLDWFERGRSSLAGNTFPATNAYRFQRGESSLEISHLRFGPSNPVHLVSLRERDGALASASPHICAQDLYSLRLTLEPNALIMHWRIDSPASTTDITSTYTLR